MKFVGDSMIENKIVERLKKIKRERVRLVYEKCVVVIMGPCDV